MEYIKFVDEVILKKDEVKDYIKNNNIEDSEELRLLLKNIKEDIIYKLSNNQSKLKKEIDTLLKKDFVYIKNKDVYFCTKFSILIPNLKKIKLQNNNFKFSEYNWRLIKKEEYDFLINSREKIISKDLMINDRLPSNKEKVDISACNIFCTVSNKLLEKIKKTNLHNAEKILLFLEKGLIPDDLTISEKDIYLNLVKLIGQYNQYGIEQNYYFIVNELDKNYILLKKINNLFNKKYIKMNEKNVYFNTYLNKLISTSKNKKTYLGKFIFKKLNSYEQKYFYNEIKNNEIPFEKEENQSSNIPVYDKLKLKNNKSIVVFMANNLIPESLSEESQKIYLELLGLYNKKVISYDKNFIVDLNLLKKLFLEGLEYTDYKKNNFNIRNLKKIFLSKENKKIDLKLLKSKYLNSEKDRADIESYDETILSDPNRGHWDLWDCRVDKNSEIKKIEEPLFARNPLLDVKKDGIIGIDFGTKSTVVVLQENNVNIMPMRIGMGNYSKQISKEQYENPTIMQFINLDKFLKAYNEKIGRPDTKWGDLTISHTAQNSLINSSSDNYYSFLSDLKQWAGDCKRQLHILDKNKFDITLKPYIQLSETDFDPIEVYAYYLGLYINNMRNGIYLDYLLSFPVTYELSIREKIIKSFENGIKKSLPKSILENNEIMKDFSVSAGASEPAAYAICALTEYGFDPKDDEEIFYGVFDFGGGTTDFDFGLFREAKGREQRRFDYVIEHFGASGDKLLGGENLLELMAFEVFKENKETMRKEKISFTMPSECEKFTGSEVLISSSQEAKLNTKQLVEKLRPLWEDTLEKEELMNGVISLNLFDKNGKQKPGIELLIDVEKLNNILKNRIEIGVINFFHALKLSFKVNKKDVKDVKIFLAGNSSKSKIVKDLFEVYIQKENEAINKTFKSKVKKDLFEIYPPLGSIEAYNLQEKMGIKVEENDLNKPTGKTGVAFGLITGRKGGKIKIIDKNIVNDEIIFKYYLGHNKRGKFRVEIDKDTEFNKWVEFIDSYEDRFEIYYTSQPKATDNNMNIEDVKRKICRISVTSEDEDVNVFIRFVSPSKIEYVVANRNEIGQEKYLSDIVAEELE